jgi:hypothetical protein
MPHHCPRYKAACQGTKPLAEEQNHLPKNNIGLWVMPFHPDGGREGMTLMLHFLQGF